MMESGRVPENGRIRVSMEKLSGRVPEKSRITVSTENRYNSSEYKKNSESVRVSKNCPGDYPKKSRITMSTEK